jgi:hypothetical protein
MLFQNHFPFYQQYYFAPYLMKIAEDDIESAIRWRQGLKRQ